MYELHSLILKLQDRRAQFEHIYTEEDELVKVREILNRRLVILRDRLIEEPNNETLLLEYGFCQDEADRIEVKLEEFRKKYETKEAQIEKYQRLVDYNLQELYSYINFIDQFKMDDKLYKAMKDSIESLDRNMRKLKELEKEE